VAAATEALVDLYGPLDWVETVRPGVACERWRADSSQPLPDLSRRVVLRSRLVFADRRDNESGRPLDEARPRLRPRLPRTVQPAFVAADGIDRASGIAAACLALAGELGSIGGASLSPDTPNQITTNRTARSHHVLELVRRVRHRIADEHGIEVRPMLHFVDEHGQTVDP
jgi:hypothetical protein